MLFIIGSFGIDLSCWISWLLHCYVVVMGLLTMGKFWLWIFGASFFFSLQTRSDFIDTFFFYFRRTED